MERIYQPGSSCVYMECLYQAAEKPQILSPNANLAEKNDVFKEQNVPNADRTPELQRTDRQAKLQTSPAKTQPHFTSAEYNKLHKFLIRETKLVPNAQINSVLLILFGQEGPKWDGPNLHWTHKILRDGDIPEQNKSSFLYTALLHCLNLNNDQGAMNLAKVAIKNKYHKNFFMVDPYFEGEHKYLNSFLLTMDMPRFRRKELFYRNILRTFQGFQNNS